MIACGGGKNGSGSQANFAVATSHKLRNNPSANSRGVRCFSPAPNRPSQLPLSVATSTPPATTNAAIASSWVRDQSPRSCHRRHESPKPSHATLVNTPAAFARTDAGNASGRPANAAPSSTDCGSATALDAEYVDINPLRKFRCVGARLEDGDALQVFGIALQLALEDVADGMMVMGVVPHHGFDVRQGCSFRRIRLERSCRLFRILRHEHRRIQKRLRDRARRQRLLAHQAPAQADDAAALVLVFAVEIRGDRLVTAV